MLTRITMLLGVLLASLAIGAGCGDDDETAGNATTEQRPATSSTEQRPDDAAGDDARTEPGTTGSSSENASPPPLREPKTIEEAVDTCRDATDRYEISEARKQQMREICEAFGSGDEERMEEAAREICDSVIPKSTPDRQSSYDKCVESLSQGFQL